MGRGYGFGKAVKRQNIYGIKQTIIGNHHLKKDQMKIGTNTTIHPTAYVAEGVVIGDDCTIGPFCRIGLPAEYRDYKPEDKGRVFIGNGTVLTGNVCVDSGREGWTFIGSGCMLMSNTHVGHDCNIKDNTTLAPGAVIGGLSHLGEWVWIGINASLHQHSFVPNRCIIGAGSVLTKKHWNALKEGQAYAGNPARHIGANKKWSNE